MKPIKPMGPVEWGLLFTLSVVWGASFFFGKVAVAEMRPFFIVFCRLALASVALNILLVARGMRMPSSFRVWKTLFIMGFFNNMLPFSLIFWGQTQITSSLASILNSTAPLFTVILAHFLTRDERLTVNRLAGIIVGMTGVVLLIGPDALRGIGKDTFAQIGILGAAFSYAVASVYGRRFAGVNPLVAAAGQITAATVMILPITLFFDRPWQNLSLTLSTWGSVIGLGLFCTALAYVVFFRLLASAGATNVMLVAFLVPVSAILLGTVILGERLELRQAGGMLLIAAGLAAIDGRILPLIRSRCRRQPVRAEALRPPAQAAEPADEQVEDS